MKMYHKWVTLLILLFAALISYAYGFSQGVTIFIILGVALELGFWIGLFSKSRKL